MAVRGALSEECIWSKRGMEEAGALDRLPLPTSLSAIIATATTSQYNERQKM